MECNMIEKNNGYVCGVYCPLFIGESVNMYSLKYEEVIFEKECKLAGKMVFSVNTGKRLE